MSKGRLLVTITFVAACGAQAPGAAPAPSPGAPPPPATTTTPVASVPRAVKVARTTTMPACGLFVGADREHKTIASAIAAAGEGAIICVAEGEYREAITAGERGFTLAGGFKADFAERDSARYVTRAAGDGTNRFLTFADPGPHDQQLTVIDGFEITGYSQAIVRDLWYSQRFDLTNNSIHDNRCAEPGLNGAAFALNNVSGAIRGNVIRRNTCGRGGGGAINDSVDENQVVIESNLIEANAGDEPGISHGGGLYLFAHDLRITANDFAANTATGWGGGLYVGAFSGGGQETTAVLAWNLYRANQAGGAGGGLFCDDSARCTSDHEVYTGNCGGNIFLDSGSDDAAATNASFDHLTNVGAKDVSCGAPGAGVVINKNNPAADTYAFTNALFWGNARDIDAACDGGCAALRVSVSWSSLVVPPAGAVAIAVGAGMAAPADPLFVAPDALDFHLRSTKGHWTPAGFVTDVADSPALRSGDPAAPVPDNPARAGARTELGAYGNSPEASLVE